MGTGKADFTKIASGRSEEIGGYPEVIVGLQGDVNQQPRLIDDRMKTGSYFRPRRHPTRLSIVLLRNLNQQKGGYVMEFTNRKLMVFVVLGLLSFLFVLDAAARRRRHQKLMMHRR